jgi:chromate reductase, NAD(P)H dehydrogenase (quinone)
MRYEFVSRLGASNGAVGRQGGWFMADKQLDVLVICGSLRKGSYNAALARTLPALAPAGLKLRPAPAFDKFPIYNHDIQDTTGFPVEAKAWADAIRSADGLIIVSPEYNWSIPGGLKNAIDWVSRMKDQPFKDKPVALQSAAGGILGGSRMQYHLRQSLTSVDVILFGRPEVLVTFAAQKFDEKTLELKDQTAIDLIKQQLAGFEKFIRRLGPKE